ncbi:MAG: 3-deoxy-D-manno-octulosonic acid transferase [Bacteroidetes bacterium]|nr:3-deoxy-D-manno-octulosonic acid transferase [Bacteroidota bacterium]
MSIFFYTIFLWLYNTGIRIVSPWNPKARLWLNGRKDILEKINSLGLQKSDGAIWMHCASLGEFEQGRPVIERIRKLYPANKIILTFFSPSGYEIRKDYKGADFIFYLPMDSKKNAKIFIEAVKPSLVIWVKYDYWFHYLHELKKRDIPTLLISASFRSGQPFFEWYGRLHRYMLDCFTHLFVQTEDSKKLLASIGFSGNVSIGGDTRFDRVIEIASSFSPIPLIENFCDNKKVIVAGSTWEEDEEQLDHYANMHPDIRFIIAPHEIDEPRLKEIENLFHESIRFSVLEKKMMDDSRPLTENSKGVLSTANRQPSTPNVLIIDNIGMLSRLYKYATIAYVGGGFGDDGVHNVLEAAVYRKPVVFGPVIEKYFEAMDLVESGGGIVIDSALEAEAVFDRLFNNTEEYNYSSEAAGDYVFGKKGATEIVVRYIQENRLLTS